MSVFDFASPRGFLRQPLLTATRVIKHKEILTLGAQPAIVVPAPGPNRIRLLVHMSIVAYKPVAVYGVAGTGLDSLTGSCAGVLDTVSVEDILSSEAEAVKRQMFAALQPLSVVSPALKIQMSQAENQPIILYSWNNYTGGAPENKLIVNTVYYDTSIV